MKTAEQTKPARTLAEVRLANAAPELLEACKRFIALGKAGGDTSWHSKDVQDILYRMMVAVGEAEGTTPKLLTAEEAAMRIVNHYGKSLAVLAD